MIEEEEIIDEEVNDNATINDELNKEYLKFNEEIKQSEVSIKA